MIINPWPCTSFEATSLYIQAHPDRRVGLTSGTFDLFHDFHERYLERCRRALGHNGILIVGVDSDAEVRRVKGKGRPIQSEFQRRMLLDSNKNVTFVYIQDGVGDFTTVCETLLTLRGGVVFRNDAFEGKKDEVALGKAKDHPDVQVVIVPDITELDSTTALTEQIQHTAPKAQAWNYAYCVKNRLCPNCGQPMTPKDYSDAAACGAPPVHMKCPPVPPDVP